MLSSVIMVAVGDKEVVLSVSVCEGRLGELCICTSARDISMFSSLTILLLLVDLIGLGMDRLPLFRIYVVRVVVGCEGSRAWEWGL